MTYLNQLKVYKAQIYLILIVIKLNKHLNKNNYIYNSYWGLGIGDWGLGIGDWAQSPIPNPQSPIKYLFYNILIFFILMSRKQ